MSFCLSVTGWNVLLLVTPDLYLHLNSIQEGVGGPHLRTKSIIRRGTMLLCEGGENRVSEQLSIIKCHCGELWIFRERSTIFLINR